MSLNGIYDNRGLSSKKPLPPKYEMDEPYGYCPSCDFNNGEIKQPVFRYWNYCCNCGQELDWTDWS